MRYLPYLFAIMIILPTACSKNSSQPAGDSPEESPEEDPLRYNYPNYKDGHMSFYHTFYMDCGDSEYWDNVFRSREFFAEDSLFIIMTEEIGFKMEMPNLTLKEEIDLICSNGDTETIMLNFSRPQCIDHIQDFWGRYGGIPSREHSVVGYNGFIDVQQDTIQVIAQYKSYWTGEMVFDTAYVSP